MIQTRRAVYCTGDPLPVAMSQALEVGMQFRNVLPQPVPMGGVSFSIVGSVVQFLMVALQILTGADQSLMLVFQAGVHT